MSPTHHFLYPDTDPRHRKLVEEAVNAQESEPQDVLAEALHDAMCDISHHDRPPARCSKWATYPNIAASVLPRLRAALVRTPETLDGTFWLIERGQPEKQIPTVWWVGNDDWTTDATKAQRFFSRDAAQTAIEARSGVLPRQRFIGRAVEHALVRTPETLDVERLAEAIWTAETGDYLQYADPVEARKFAAAIAAKYAAL